jgi:uncharacterized small protein (DUF1192 family)
MTKNKTKVDKFDLAERIQNIQREIESLEAQLEEAKAELKKQ